MLGLLEKWAALLWTLLLGNDFKIHFVASKSPNPRATFSTLLLELPKTAGKTSEALNLTKTRATFYTLRRETRAKNDTEQLNMSNR